jgi:hypothetical protein
MVLFVLVKKEPIRVKAILVDRWLQIPLFKVFVEPSNGVLFHGDTVVQKLVTQAFIRTLRIIEVGLMKIWLLVVHAMMILRIATGLLINHGHNTTRQHGHNTTRRGLLRGQTITTGPSTILLGLRHGHHTRRGRAVGLLIRLTHGLIHGRLHGRRTPHGHHTVLRGLHSGLDHGHRIHRGRAVGLLILILTTGLIPGRLIHHGHHTITPTTGPTLGLQVGLPAGLATGHLSMMPTSAYIRISLKCKVGKSRPVVLVKYSTSTLICRKHGIKPNSTVKV